MRSTHFGTALRSVALLVFLSLSGSLLHAAAQAHHEAVAPNPQRYQQAPEPQRLPSFAPEPEQRSEPNQDPASGQSADDQPAPAQPMQQQSAPSDSLGATVSQLLAFFQQHMAVTFLCILLLAPFWAMLGMRREKHPYDNHK